MATTTVLIEHGLERGSIRIVEVPSSVLIAWAAIEDQLFPATTP